MTVRVYKQGDDMEIISEVREPNSSQNSNGNRMEVYRDSFESFNLLIDNDEVFINITYTSTYKLINALLSDDDLRLVILERLYFKESCKRIWRGWEENDGN